VDYIVRQILAPFASFATGAILTIVLGVFVFGVKNQEVMTWLAIGGGFLAAIPALLALLSGLFKPPR
jgi:hypothetical protein